MSNDPECVRLIANAPTEMQASVLAAELAENGIRSSIAGDNTAAFRVHVPGTVQVYVQEKDLARAREVLASAQGKENEVDWSAVDVGSIADGYDSGRDPAILRLSFWRRVVQVYVSIYLLWIAAAMVRTLFVAVQGGLGGP